MQAECNTLPDYYRRVDMKKKEMIRRKNKLKQVKSYRYLKYAQYACVLIILLFLIYVVGAASVYQQSYEELMSENPVVITGFMICTANLYVWWALKHFNEDIQSFEHIESIRINLIVLAIGQFLLFNFVSMILMIISLVKYFRWRQFSFRQSLREIKKDGQLSVLITTLIVMVLFVALVFALFFAIRG